MRNDRSHSGQGFLGVGCCRRNGAPERGRSSVNRWKRCWAHTDTWPTEQTRPETHVEEKTTLPMTVTPLAESQSPSRWTLSWRSVSRCVSKDFIPKCPGSVYHWTQLIPSNPVKPSHKNGTAGARETARSGKYTPRRHKGLRLALLRLPVWRAGYISTSRHWGGGDWQRSETLWAASLGKSASFRFRVRTCPKNKMESNWRKHA